MIELLATDPGVKSDVNAWCNRTKNDLLGISDENNGTYKAVIRVTSKADKNKP